MTTFFAHAVDPLVGGEFTLCGNAFDAADGDGGDPDDDSVPRPVFALPGEVVTCPGCRRAIREIKKYRYFRVPVHDDHE